MTPPFAVDHHLLGGYLKWPDGKEGFVGGISTSTAEGVIDPRCYKNAEEVAAAGRLRASLVLYRRTDPLTTCKPTSWHVTDLNELAGRILAKPRKKETHHA